MPPELKLIPFISVGGDVLCCEVEDYNNFREIEKIRDLDYSAVANVTTNYVHMFIEQWMESILSPKDNGNFVHLSQCLHAGYAAYCHRREVKLNRKFKGERRKARLALHQLKNVFLPLLTKAYNLSIRSVTPTLQRPPRTPLSFRKLCWQWTLGRELKSVRWDLQSDVCGYPVVGLSTLVKPSLCTQCNNRTRESSLFASLALLDAILPGAKITLNYGSRIRTPVRLLASHQGESGSIPSWATRRFSQEGIVPDDAAGRRVFSGISRRPPPYHSGAAPFSSHLTLICSRDFVVESRPNLSTQLDPDLERMPRPDSMRTVGVVSLLAVAVLLTSAHQFQDSSRYGKRDEVAVPKDLMHGPPDLQILIPLNTASVEHNTSSCWSTVRRSPRKAPPTNGIVQHDSHLRKSGDPGRGLSPVHLGGRQQAGWTTSKAGSFLKQAHITLASYHRLRPHFTQFVIADGQTRSGTQYVVQRNDTFILTLINAQINFLGKVAAVVQWSDYLPPTEANRARFPAVSLPRIFARGNRAGRCRWSAGFLGDLPFPLPLHSAPYSPLFTPTVSQAPHDKSRPNKFLLPPTPCHPQRGNSNCGAETSSGDMFANYSRWRASLTARRRGARLPTYRRANIVRRHVFASSGTDEERRRGGEIWAALSIEFLRASEGEARLVWSSGRNERPGETGDPRENHPTSGDIRYDYHMPKFAERPRRKSNPVQQGKGDRREDLARHTEYLVWV
ncbi:hypothetical protein PR048_000455 [Dryococelus australis]|uniref:Uncharacterized protein n=1 Tax=Dryococelus australis TaxID=614101 RepID=A0ABQ9IEN4_9NEOP|nr:hypothetical protein PR048_000455 [Dryococelus australis]